MRYLSLSSLRVRLVLLVFASIAPAVALILYGAAEQRGYAAVAAQENAIRLAREIAADHEQLLDGARQLLTGLAQVPAVRTLDVKACNALFADLLRQFPLYTNLTAATPTGAMFCSGVPLRASADLSDRSDVQETLNQRGFTVSGHSTDLFTGKTNLVAGYPVLDSSGVARALLFAGLDLSWVGPHVAAQLPEGSTFTLIDRTGTILSRHPKGDRWVGRMLPDAPIIQFALARKGEGLAELPGLDGIRRLHAIKPLRGFPEERIACIVGIPLSLAFAEVDRVLRRSMIWLAIVTALTLLAAWGGAGLAILRPMQTLLGMTQRLREGDLSARSNLSAGQGELTQLGRAFDEMAASLEAHQAEAQRMAEALRESNSTLRAMIQASPLAIVALDDNEKVTMWNPAAQRMFGWSEEEMLGQSPPYVSEDKQEVFRALQETELAGKIRAGLELRHRRRDGSMIDVSLSTAPIRDAAGERVGTLGLLEDITDRKRAEAALLKRTHQLEAIRLVGAEMTRELDLSALLALIAKRARTLLDAEACTVRLLDPERQVLLPSAWDGESVLAVQGFVLRIGEGVIGECARRREGIIVSDYRACAFAHPYVTQHLPNRTALAHPLLYRDRLLGAIGAHRNPPHRPFTQRDLDLLRLFANHAAIAIENARLFEQVRTGQEELWRLTQRLVSAQEEERRRLSRELHDEAGQALAALRIGLGLIRGDLPAEAESLRQRLNEALALADATTDQIRRLAQALRPPALDTLGLDATLEGFCRVFAGQTGLTIEYAGKVLPGLPDPISIHLYRWLQEALTNVSRHAHARWVRAALGHDGETITLTVEDDGVGFDPTAFSASSPHAGIGLTGMRERLELLHGRLEIASRPGRGTRLTAMVPWRETE